MAKHPSHKVVVAPGAQNVPHHIPRIAFEAFTQKIGLGKASDIPTKLAMFYGAETLPPEVRIIAAALAQGEPVKLSFSTPSGVCYRIVIK